MKKGLLLLCLLAFGTYNVSAQCTPNPLYQDSLFGVWPDTTTNFSNGLVGVFYTDTMNLIVPIDAGDIDPAYAGVNLDSIQLVNVTGLPPGLGIECNSHTNGPCTMLPSQLACVLLEGTPTQAGTFPITIEILAWTTIVVPISVPYTFTGYSIDVGTVGLEEFNAVVLQDVKNVPNPFASSTDVQFTVSRAAQVELKVFDLLGQNVYTAVEKVNKGENSITFKGDEYEQGIYLYQLSLDGAVHTGRMILDR